MGHPSVVMVEAIRRTTSTATAAEQECPAPRTGSVPGVLHRSDTAEATAFELSANYLYTFIPSTSNSGSLRRLSISRLAHPYL